MGKRDSLLINMSVLQNKVQVDFGKSMYYDQIYNNDALLMYKYVSLMQINDYINARDSISNRLEGLRMQDTLNEGSEEQRNLEDQLKSYDSYIDAAKRLYSCEGEYEKIACLPIDGIFEQTMLNHKNDLEGIFDVNEETVRSYSDMVNTSFFNLNEDNEEINVNYGEAIRLNELAFNSDIVLPSLEQGKIEEAQNCCERLNQLSNDKEEKTREEEQLFEEIAELIEEENYIKANELMDKYEDALLSSCNGNISISDIDADMNEVDALSDKMIDDAEGRNIDAVREEGLYNDNDNEISYGPSL